MEMLTQGLTIGGMLAGAVIWICKSMFNPLKETLERIAKSLEKLNDALDKEKQERHELEIWLQEVDVRGKSTMAKWQKLIDFKEDTIRLGSVLRLPAQYPYESVVEFMVFVRTLAGDYFNFDPVTHVLLGSRTTHIVTGKQIGRAHV